MKNYNIRPHRHQYIVEKDNKWGLVLSKSTGNFVKLKNNVALPFEYDAIHKSHNSFFYIVKANNSYGVFSNINSFNQITEIKYSKIDLTEESINGFQLLRVVDKNGERFFVGENGAEFFEN